MVSEVAASVSDALAQKVASLEQAMDGINDASARKRPADGAWSIAENVSHLCGEDARAFLSTVTRFVTEDVPEIDVTPGISHFESRADAPIADLVAAFRTQYDQIVAFLAKLDDGQLKRTAHLPLLKETPFGEYPTLEQWVTAISEFHLGGHIAQIAQTRNAVGG